MTTPALQSSGLRAGYAAADVLHAIDLSVEPGETVAVLGPNGAGKTTLLRTLAGLHRLRAGTIEFEGRDISRMSANARARAGLVLVPEGGGVFGTLSVAENLRVVQRRGSSVDEVLDMFPVLRQRHSQQAGTLSGGERQMLGLAKALLQQPHLLLLDEPSLGLAPLVVGQVFARIGEIARSNRTTIVVEQNTSKAMAVADRVMLLSRGALTWSGTPAELNDSGLLASGFLGGR